MGILCNQLSKQKQQKNHIPDKQEHKKHFNNNPKSCFLHGDKKQDKRNNERDRYVYIEKHPTN